MIKGFQKYTRFLTAMWLMLCISIQAFSQDSIIKPTISNVFLNVKDELLQVTFQIPGDITFNRETANIYEDVNGKICPLSIYDFSKNQAGPATSQDTFSILFLLDYSGSMRDDNRLLKSKDAITRTLDEIELPPGSQIYFAAFHDNIFDTEPIQKDNIQPILAGFPVPKKGKGKYTDLYRALIYKAAEMKSLPGKKVLVILSDGKDDTKFNPFYETNPRYQKEDVYAEFRTLDAEEDFLVFPIGLGKGTDSLFLKELSRITIDTSDRFIYSENANELAGIVLDVVSKFNSDYTVRLIPEITCSDWVGENRKIIIEIKNSDFDATLTDEYTAGSPFGPINFRTPISDIFYWLKLLVLGILILGFLLLALMYLVPFFKQREFKEKYVIPYVPEPNKIKKDPITQDAFKEGDLVVVKCSQMTSLSTWQALGHCPNYPNCMEYNDPCNGAGGEDIKGSFFSQQGIFRILNWLWYGAVGGFLGWLFYGLSRWQDFRWLNKFVYEILTGEALLDTLLQSEGGKNLLNNHVYMVDNFLYGLFTGTFLLMAITFAEELGQTRKFSIKRLLIRSSLGLVVAFIIFSSSAVLHYLLIQDRFISWSITWLVFSIGFGIVLSVNSSITIKRGLIGSVIAVAVAFGIFYLIFNFLQHNDGLQKLLSNIALGAVLGALVATILASLEDFELVYISPTEYSGMVKPISKWLKKGMEIFIGTSSKCYVFIKWDDDSAQDKHAKLIYFSGAVYIIPLHETLINGVIIPENQKTPLQNNDIIQLGRYSNSKMMYKEKRKGVKEIK